MFNIHGVMLLNSDYIPAEFEMEVDGQIESDANSLGPNEHVSLFDCLYAFVFFNYDTCFYL